jgi:hypothetical protein
MAKQILSEEFRKMQKLAGLLKEEKTPFSEAPPETQKLILELEKIFGSEHIPNSIDLEGYAEVRFRNLDDEKSTINKKEIDALSKLPIRWVGLNYKEIMVGI